jgi:Fe-S oxidoreductase
MLGVVFSPVSNFFMRLGPFKWFLEKITGIDGRRLMPAFRRGSFLKAGRKYLAACKPIEKPIDKVAYFVDTYANYNDHELGFAVLDVLRHNDIEVILPKQRPAPLPAIVYGDVKRAKRDLAYSVKHLAKLVQDGYKIVCSEPSAALCLKDELRHFVAEEDAKLVSENTYELMSYLWDMYKRGVLKNPKQTPTPPKERRVNSGVGAKQTEDFVYHLPCHLCVVGSDTATIELLQKHFGVNVVDLKAGCCGLAGTFGMQSKNYDLSDLISESLKKALESSPTKNVLTECAACKMQIEHISHVVVQHPIKVMAECYRGVGR